MTLYERLTQSAIAYPAKDAEHLMLEKAQPVSELTQIKVSHLPDGRWLYTAAGSDDLPCVVADTLGGPLSVYCDGETPFLPDTRFLIRTAFECRFCHEGIVSLHAACVETDGVSIAFTGHSGLGKSTRAQAWIDAFNAQWISGDRPSVRLGAQQCIACGVPWDGKEQIFRNVERPLKCILEVRRSPANYVRKLSNEQARQLIMQQSFVPMWDTDAAMMAMANARKLVKTTPVYRVFCGPTPEDARAIHDILFHHPEQIHREAKQMNIRAGFILRDVVNEHVVMPVGENIARFDGALVLNEVSAFLFRLLQNPISREDLLIALLNEYDVDEAAAANDLDALLARFNELGILEN